MTPERHQQIYRIYLEALEVETARRMEFLERVCDGDEELRREVESILASDDQAGSFLEKPGMEVATTMGDKDRRQLAAGHRIGHYEILSLLGAGGMGEVYLAEDARLGRKVALKLLPAKYTAEPDRVARFEREARAASALNHPNIITIHEIGEALAGRFIVMEFVEGCTLRALARGPVAFDSLIDWGGQIAKALKVAHAAGVTHRDIKPENIMVRYDGFVKVLDFGLARLIHTGGADSADVKLARTAPGIMLGTVRYMSPEQAVGGTVDRSTDIFALGILLYELGTGQHPFAADSARNMLYAIASRTPLAPSRLNPEIPAALESLILRMLEKDARLRLTAAEVEALLQEMSGSQPNFETSRIIVADRRQTVGRGKERAELRESFASASSRRGLLLCVAGEPGMGKTTLVEDFLAELESGDQALHIGRGRCSERLAGAEAYMPLLEALESLLYGQSGQSIAHAMKRLAPSWYAQVAPLAAETSSSARRARPGSQEMMKRELSAFFQEITRLRPLALFLDDLHWADVSTIDLLAYLAGKLAGARALIVVTYRPSDLLLAKHPFLQIKPDLQARGVCREILLEFLTRDDIEKYLALQFPDHCFPAELPFLIHAKTEGNPLFMTDLVRYLSDRGVIAQAQGRWAMASALPEIERDLPASMRGMIERKIAQLEPDDCQLLAAAGVQGYEFDSAVVAKALSLEPDEVEERLEALERIYAFVRLVEEKEFPDRTLTQRYRFVHALYLNALYGSLRPTRKTRLSKAVAEALLGFYGEQSGRVASELAALFEAAREFARAAEYYSLATENSLRVCAYKEAVILARRGLNLLDAAPESVERARQELRMQVALSSALMVTTGYAAAETENSLLRALELCEQLGETRQHYLGLGLYYLVGAEYHAARRTAEQLLIKARSLNNPVLLIGAHATLGFTLEFLGEPVEARHQFEQAIDLYDPEQHLSLRSRYNFDPGLYSRSEIGFSLWLLGYADQALGASLGALDQAQKIGDPRTLANAYRLATWVHFFRRESLKVLELAETAIAYCNEHGFVNDREWINILSGWAMTEQGEMSEGLAEMRRSLAALRIMRARVAFSCMLGMLAEALARAGQGDNSFAVLVEAFEVVHQTDERYYEAELNRLKGEFLLRSRSQPLDANQRLSEAESCFRQAVEIARRQSAKFWELRATMSLARLLRQRGKPTEARETLAEIYGWFTEGFDTADLKEASALLTDSSED